MVINVVLLNSNENWGKMNQEFIFRILKYRCIYLLNCGSGKLINIKVKYNELEMENKVKLKNKFKSVFFIL